MTRHAPSYHGYRFPSEIVSHAVSLEPFEILRVCSLKAALPSLRGDPALVWDLWPVLERGTLAATSAG